MRQWRPAVGSFGDADSDGSGPVRLGDGNAADAQIRGFGVLRGTGQAGESRSPPAGSGAKVIVGHAPGLPAVFRGVDSSREFVVLGPESGGPRK